MFCKNTMEFSELEAWHVCCGYIQRKEELYLLVNISRGGGTMKSFIGMGDLESPFALYLNQFDY